MAYLLDAVLAMGVVSLSIAQADLQAVRTSQVSAASQTGQYMYGLQQGVNKYIAVNGDVLSGRSTGSITNPQLTAITVADPLHPTLAELQANGFLPEGYTLNNPSKLTFSVTVTPTDCPSEGCTIPATITSTPYTDSSGHVRNDLNSYVIRAAGLDGGQALIGSPSQFTSYNKTWSMPNSTNQAGALMMRAGVLTTGYVDTLPYYKLDGSRALTGTMQANGQNITGAGAVTANSLALPGGNSLTIGSAKYYGDGTNAQITTAAGGALFLTGADGNRANLVAQNGVFNGDVGAQNGTFSGTMVSGAVNTNSSTINGDEYVAGNHTVNGAFTARNVVNLPALAWAGYGCSANGVTTDPNGQLLSCQSGVWRNAGGGDVAYAYIGVPYNQSANLTNTYGKPLLVTAYGGVNVCGNSNAWNLTGYVNGSAVQTIADSSSGGYKQGSMSFLVPIGANYSVTSLPYNCAYGTFNLTAATLG